jgi:hypothetical protein
VIIYYEENRDGGFTSDLSTSVFDFFVSFFASSFTFLASFFAFFDPLFLGHCFLLLWRLSYSNAVKFHYLSSQI